jgi:DNA gyrase/topoisomerase IV subunit A
MVAEPEQQVLLLTSEYRFLLRTMRELMNLAELNLNLAQMESFYADQFGHEMITALEEWDSLQTAQRLMLVSSQGEAKIMPADALLPNLAQTHPYQLQRISGDPVALIPADSHEIVLITNTGSAARILVKDLPNGVHRIQRLRKDERVIDAFALVKPAEMLLVTERGNGKRFRTNALDLSDGSALASKIVNGHDFKVHVSPQHPAPIWAITTRRVCALDVNTLPLDVSAPPTKRPLLRLRPDEALVTLH